MLIVLLVVSSQYIQIRHDLIFCTCLRTTSHLACQLPLFQGAHLELKELIYSLTFSLLLQLKQLISACLESVWKCLRFAPPSSYGFQAVIVVSSLTGLYTQAVVVVVSSSFGRFLTAPLSFG